MAECTSTPLKGQRAKDTNKKAGEMKGGGFKSSGSAQALEGSHLSKQNDYGSYFLQGSVMIRSGENL